MLLPARMWPETRIWPKHELGKKIPYQFYCWNSAVASQLKRSNDVATNYCLWIEAPTFEQRNQWPKMWGILVGIKLLMPWEYLSYKELKKEVPFHGIFIHTESQCLTFLNKACKALVPFQALILLCMLTYTLSNWIPFKLIWYYLRSQSNWGSILHNGQWSNHRFTGVMVIFS